ncbi:MAG: (1-_4)-alpha-D-glucan 1-alpha-D-glucosylmutase [Frankiaceae bacterium]|jgi:(1->4)-alpha-D-glucan 1-alpha-D-glucosylmutase|nr:(1->4)-alpha-D-glucan 1-alpha-D-glucosylmutase [Frankiaceae bacterium]
MRVPASTYRVQVHGAFPLRAAAQIAPYLRALGVGDIYTSPLLRSTEGSTHGYDVLDHDAIDDEAGGLDGLDTLTEALRANGLGHVLDIVPNHVSVAPPADANAWWWDVLRHGRDSRYARAFDVEWSRHEGRVLLPVLGAPLVDVLAAGEIVRSGDVLRYHEHVWPIAPGTAARDDAVADILPRQHYLPEHWRRASHDLNYRRFFDVTTLAGLRVEERTVFDESHRLVLALVRSGVVTGLRVDHPDGLADPAVYFDRLANGSGSTWTVAEKILETGEALPPSWRVAGTTGYDALAELTALFTDPSGEAALTRLYADLTGEPTDYDVVADASKRLVLTEIFGSEVEWLHHLVPEEPRDAIVELLAAMDVYRTYVTAGTPPSATDRAALSRAAARAAGRRPDLAEAVERLAAHVTDGGHPAFATRFQQVSGPVMAKGVEDTAFYRFNRLVSLNEVGGSPASFGSSVEAFHEACAARQRRAPYGMTTLSTHDTKRSEDVRARISLLAEVPEEWAAAVRRWTAMNARHRCADGPDADMEYLLYQTFVGAYPLPVDRALAFAEKAAREAKRHTSWLDPDPAYEAAVADWVRAVLSDEEFLADLDVFATPLVVHGWVVSLAQKLVQLTMPGVPDVYQGSELWDLSLVDPDNRRPVDYDLRAELLAFVDSAAVEDVGDRAAEGAPKLLLVSRALRLRRARPAAFAGAYQPLGAAGAWADRVVAFARGGDVVTVVPRLSVHVDDWKDTAVAVPAGSWRNVLTGDTVAGGDRLVADLWARFPVALLERA